MTWITTIEEMDRTLAGISRAFSGLEDWKQFCYRELAGGTMGQIRLLLADNRDLIEERLYHRYGVGGEPQDPREMQRHLLGLMYVQHEPSAWFSRVFPGVDRSAVIYDLRSSRDNVAPSIATYVDDGETDL